MAHYSLISEYIPSTLLGLATIFIVQSIIPYPGLQFVMVSLSVMSSVHLLGGGDDWQLRYSAVQALVCVCRGLGGVVLQEGMRNVAWIALQEHLGRETDQRVRDATRVIEVLRSIMLSTGITIAEGIVCYQLQAASDFLG